MKLIEMNKVSVKVAQSTDLFQKTIAWESVPRQFDSRLLQ